MSGHRGRGPAEIAWHDQATAAARDAAADGHTAVIVTDYARDGQACSWCDCPDDSPAHNQPGYRCTGCPRDARYLVRLWYATPAQVDLAVCERHYRDVARTLAAMFGGTP